MAATRTSRHAPAPGSADRLPVGPVPVPAQAGPGSEPNPPPPAVGRLGTSEPVLRRVGGPVRLGRRTKLLVKHLTRGDIALIDHLDIDRVSAEELIAAGTVAVLNCSPSSGGSYPNLGPQLLVEAGILLVDLADDSLFETLSDGEPVVVAVTTTTGAQGHAVGEVLRGGEPLARGEVLDLARICAETEARRSEIGEALERFAHNTIEHMREERELLAGRIELPRFATDFRDRSSLVVVRGVGHQRDLRALRPFIRDMRPVIVAVDGAAEALLEEGLTPNMIVGDMDSAGEAALRCGAELVVHSYPGRACARTPAPGGAGPELQAGAGARNQPGRRPADRRREGRPADRLGGLAVQPRRVPGPQPQRHVLDLPHAPAHRRDPRGRQGREPPLPAPARPDARSWR